MVRVGSFDLVCVTVLHLIGSGFSVLEERAARCEVFVVAGRRTFDEVFSVLVTESGLECVNINCEVMQFVPFFCRHVA